MKTKPYPQIEEKPIVANEPAVAYGNIKREKLSPYTIEEIHVSMDETEADLIAGKVYSHDDVMREIFHLLVKLNRFY